MAIAARIPAGRLTTYREIGEVLEVPARHVAYILSTLDDLERETYPWHRITADGGTLGNHRRWEDQKRLLIAEGLAVNGKTINDFERVHLPIPLNWVIGPTRPLR